MGRSVSDEADGVVAVRSNLYELLPSRDVALALAEKTCVLVGPPPHVMAVPSSRMP